MILIELQFHTDIQDLLGNSINVMTNIVVREANYFASD